jgi:hypothetical protein
VYEGHTNKHVIVALEEVTASLDLNTSNCVGGLTHHLCKMVHHNTNTNNDDDDDDRLDSGAWTLMGPTEWQVLDDGNECDDVMKEQQLTLTT